ncbi:Protein of unknown function [Bacillus thuringiensis]|uniref:Uncharacterized protein n=1 Tax=Bacillus thuringiensis TaxID=1428 RepID=A0A1C4BHU8_BACTU|nr:Protein of unknown function [Bacillus thuringiensis]
MSEYSFGIHMKY